MINDLLHDFPVIITVPVRWGDMDAFGHVNNTVYLRFFEDGRIAFFERIGALQAMETTGVGPILAATSCHFRLPVTHPDQVSIGTRITHLGADRFTMAHRVVSHQHQKVAADGDATIVSFNYRTNAKAPVPAEVVAAVYALQPGLQSDPPSPLTPDG